MPTTYAIPDGRTVMAATLYTGNSTGTQSQTIVNSVNGVGFQPDFVWNKARSIGRDHALYDSVRGTGKYLSSDLTGAELSGINGVSAFNSNGYTLGSDGDSNINGATFVGWQWKAGGTAVSNTSGSITTTVSANATAGFSVITYTGTGIDNKTIGHGLNSAPQFLIWKPRNASTDWMVWHIGLSGYNYDVRLNTTAAQGTGANPLNSTAPSPTVVTLRNQGDVNGSGIPIVCYAFAPVAGYSAFGSYTANGSADGPFIYCGFRPRWIMFKRTTSATNWYIVDTAIEAYNAGTTGLYPNTSSSESTEGALDILSNGFKCRAASGAFNYPSNETFIYAAFAENPFKYANAR